MNKHIVEHLFEFWAEIGKSGGVLNQENGFKFTKPLENSWPSKVFNIEIAQLELDGLKQGIKNGKLPNSIGVFEQEEAQKLLKSNGFMLTSTVKAMAMDISSVEELIMDESGIVSVDSNEKAEIFADVASKSFGYQVLASTITPLYANRTFKLFLGKFGDFYVSCGILYLDKNGISGIHMIGTLPEYRGLGLGKKMTQHLINEAIKKGSKDVYLVASQAGERIYTKIGFTTHGVLESYSM